MPKQDIANLPYLVRLGVLTVGLEVDSFMDQVT
jgi:hypothetical protein